MMKHIKHNYNTWLKCTIIYDIIVASYSAAIAHSTPYPPPYAASASCPYPIYSSADASVYKKKRFSVDTRVKKLALETETEKNTKI